MSLFCYALLCVHSSFAIILKRKRERADFCLLLLSCGCLFAVYVLSLFLAVPWVGMQRVIVIFPHHTHLRFDLLLIPKKCFSWCVSFAFCYETCGSYE